MVQNQYITGMPVLAAKEGESARGMMTTETTENNRRAVLGMRFVRCGVVFKEVALGWAGGPATGVLIGQPAVNTSCDPSFVQKWCCWGNILILPLLVKPHSCFRPGRPPVFAAKSWLSPPIKEVIPAIALPWLLTFWTPASQTSGTGVFSHDGCVSSHRATGWQQSDVAFCMFPLPRSPRVTW